MSTIEITASRVSDNPGSGELARPHRGVAIVYEGRPEGRAALRYARALAGHVGGRGTFTRAVLTVARDHDADVIVLPARRRGRLRRMVSRDRAKMLKKRTSASVIVAPDAADC
jgi:nucleotide-binding universal stress UspA family protein